MLKSILLMVALTDTLMFPSPCHPVMSLPVSGSYKQVLLVGSGKKIQARNP